MANGELLLHYDSLILPGALPVPWQHANPCQSILGMCTLGAQTNFPNFTEDSFSQISKTLQKTEAKNGYTWKYHNFGTFFEAKEIQTCCFDMAPEMWHILYEIHSEIRDVDASSVAEGQFLSTLESIPEKEWQMVRGCFFARHERVHFQRGFPKNVVNNSYVKIESYWTLQPTIYKLHTVYQ